MLLLLLLLLSTNGQIAVGGGRRQQQPRHVAALAGRVDDAQQRRRRQRPPGESPLPSFTEFYRVLPSFPPFSSTPTVLPSFFVPGFVIVIILHFQVLSVFYRALPFSFFNGHFASVHLVVYRVLPSFFFV